MIKPSLTDPTKFKLIWIKPLADIINFAWCACIENSRKRLLSGSLFLSNGNRWRFNSILCACKNQLILYCISVYSIRNGNKYLHNSNMMNSRKPACSMWWRLVSKEWCIWQVHRYPFHCQSSKISSNNLMWSQQNSVLQLPTKTIQT